jgi:hypothetical protein
VLERQLVNSIIVSNALIIAKWTTVTCCELVILATSK